ncbi:hypothetical protein HFO38_24315 [Rhizobium leguminosarum]|uniref:hypothetical protein n=1 Tax=Rhizobium leguminosarum TaxID=384 RepID=UPI001C9497F0|nr:hypothetical protein [Rhizobium leguminosarum]MBY5705802.1 hypothetical protein [Rhizobium leguminosarum]
MLSPYAIDKLLKHFDAIDRHVTRYMTYPRPRDEESMTAMLVDLLDEDVQVREGIAYNIRNLREDLAAVSDPTSVAFTLETHRYRKDFENRVSQADLGLIVRYENHYEPELSGQRSWLLQAKRLYETKYDPSRRYEPRARFGAFDAEQDARIRELVRHVDDDFFRYLLYCPRPDALDQSTRTELSYFRSRAVASDIFDFASGLQVRDDVLDGFPTLAAGIFVADVEGCPKTLGAVHAGLLTSATPFSWFIVQHIPGARPHPRGGFPDRLGPRRGFDLQRGADDLVSRIVRGDEEVVGIISKELSERTWDGALLPAATLTITISAGEPVDRDRPRWDKID